MKITDIKAIEILDSRGKPTVRTFITLEDGTVHQASVPSGASTGAHEAVELRDNDPKRHAGQGVLKAVGHVNTEIKDAVVGMEISDLKAIDMKMIEVDGTENKGNLGANAILSVSMAAVRAAASVEKKPLWKFINEYYFRNSTLGIKSLEPAFPRLMVNLINGGKHANWNFDIQEFMIMTVATIPTESTRVTSEIFAELGKQLKAGGFSTLVGDEGGYSPQFTSNEQAYDAILQAATSAGYSNTVDFELAMDAAASEYFENGSYVLKKDNKIVSPDELIEFYSKLGQKYHIKSFEDVFDQDDWDSFIKFTALSTEHHFQVVGDDFTVTNPKRISKAVECHGANAVIIKPNQIGTIYETIEAIKEARKGHWKVAVSHRSGETEDSFIADLAYGSAADFIKTGSMSRSERLAKYNRLLEIEHGL